jgi:hypothetical protein
MNKELTETQTFTYPFFLKFIYRFGNIVVTLMLIAYLIPIILYIDQNIILLVPVLIALLAVYFLNKHFILLYKILPFTIEADNEKMICKNFIFSKKELIIYYKDIQSLTGGIFENKFSGLMKVCDGKNSVCIGFYQKLINSNRLVTLILSNVKRELYDEVIENLTKQKKEIR